MIHVQYLLSNVARSRTKTATKKIEYSYSCVLPSRQILYGIKVISILKSIKIYNKIYFDG